MLWQMLGFGLTVGWMWLFFLNGPVLAAVFKSWPNGGEICFQLFLLSTALSFLVIGRRINGSLLTKKQLLLPATFLMSVSPLIVSLLLRQQAVKFPQTWLIYLLAIIGGISCTLLIMAWLESFTALTFKKSCFMYAGGVLVASLLLFAGALLKQLIGILTVTVIPGPMLYFLFKYQQQAPATERIQTTPANRPTQQSYPAKLIWLIMLFYTAGGMMYKLASIKYAFTDYFWASNLSYLAVVISAGIVLYVIPSLDLRWLYRPVLPLLAAGFILFPFFSGSRVIFSFILLQAGFALFDMYTWLLIVYIAHQSKRALPVLGLGMFWILIAMSGGNLAFSALAPFIPIQKQPDWVVVIAGLITLLASLVFQDNKVTLAGWGTENQGADNKSARAPRRESNLTLEKYNLTPREKEILVLLLKGRNNPFISENLNISPNTLKFHLRNIYQKFAVTNRQKLLDLFEKED